jgi:chlorophyll synthase
MSRPAPSVILELLKPITWFAPVWAFGCGVISAGGAVAESWLLVVAGLMLAGPLVCGTSQAVNDWFDRHVDAINEPNRPIPSGRMPGRWGLIIAIGWTALSLFVAGLMGRFVLAAAAFGLFLAWIYSAPPLRLKKNGWWGNAAVAICYEGLPWFTGAAIMSAALPDHRILLLAFVYSIGAHGIMTLNDFKSEEGDRRMGLLSLPVQLGTMRAARLACAVMIVPQLIVIAALLAWDRPLHAGAIAVLLGVQGVLMLRLLSDPKRWAAWYNATGTTLYVLGMAVAAFALRRILTEGAA